MRVPGTQSSCSSTTGTVGSLPLKCPAGETSRKVGRSSVGRTMTYTPGPVGTPAVGSGANGPPPVKSSRSIGSVVTATPSGVVAEPACAHRSAAPAVFRGEVDDAVRPGDTG